jgi:hypothetical protein
MTFWNTSFLLHLPLSRESNASSVLPYLLTIEGGTENTTQQRQGGRGGTFVAFELNTIQDDSGTRLRERPRLRMRCVSFFCVKDLAQLLTSIRILAKREV